MKNSPPFKKDDNERRKKEEKSLNFKQINYFLYQKEKREKEKKTLIEITCKQNEEDEINSLTTQKELRVLFNF